MNIEKQTNALKLLLFFGPDGFTQPVGATFFDGGDDPDLSAIAAMGGDALLFELDRATLTPQLEESIASGQFISEYGRRQFWVLFAGLSKRQTVASLIDEAEAMIPIAYQVQNDDTLTADDKNGRLTQLEERYRLWYREGLIILARAGRPDLQTEFMIAYTGKTFTFGIRSFLERGLIPGKMTKMDYQVPYKLYFEKLIRQQCDLLAATGGE